MTFRQVVNGVVAFMLLPLSLVPLYFAIPKLRADAEAVDQDRRAMSVPDVKPTSAELEAWRTVPAYKGALPVLAYHGIKEGTDHYSISQKVFTKQMDMLRRAGFHTISMAQYVRFLAGDGKYLPERPLLITFDDGRLDSYRGADKVLAEYGFRATMFVIAGGIEQSTRFYLNWNELRRMAHSGRWDVQAHAGIQHIEIPVDAKGHKAPAYANRRMNDDGTLESYEEYRRRVKGDILWAKQTLSEQIPGFTPWSFAVPFGEVGQRGTNDPRIPAFLDRFLGRQFRAVFLTEPPDYSKPNDRHERLPRMEVHRDTRTTQLYRWLRDRIPYENRVENLEKSG